LGGSRETGPPGIDDEMILRWVINIRTKKPLDVTVPRFVGFANLLGRFFFSNLMVAREMSTRKLNGATSRMCRMCGKKEGIAAPPRPTKMTFPCLAKLRIVSF
jgi:hypothetical protein